MRDRDALTFLEPLRQKALIFRLSSNAAEKSNDIVVADRQKHNRMSWSFDGSGALAVLKAACKNNTLNLWITERKISMNLKDAGWEMKTGFVA